MIINFISRILLISGLLFSLFFMSALYAQILGDVNSDNTVDIIDALLVAQEYVGLQPANFNGVYADVDGNGEIEIIDALLIAQYYVGLIDQFPGQGDTPAPTEVPTTPPTAVPTTPPTGNEGYSFTGVLPNGLINGTQVEYTTTADFVLTKYEMTSELSQY